MKPTVTTLAPLTERPHALYRFFDVEGALLYVGITHHPTGRWRQHRADKPWWHEIRTITVDPYPDRPSVLLAEKNAIHAEFPRWNAETRSGGVDEWADGLCWDSDTHGTLATLTDTRSELYLLLNHPEMATIEALVDLRTATRDFIDRDRGVPLVLTLPLTCERGVQARHIFGGDEWKPWNGGRCFRFTSRFLYRRGKRLNAAIDSQMCETASRAGIALWDGGDA